MFDFFKTMKIFLVLICARRGAKKAKSNQQVAYFDLNSSKFTADLQVAKIEKTFFANLGYILYVEIY